MAGHQSDSALPHPMYDLLAGYRWWPKVLPGQPDLSSGHRAAAGAVLIADPVHLPAKELFTQVGQARIGRRQGYQLL